MPERDAGWDFYLRTLSASARDSNTANDPASDPSLLQSVQFSYFHSNAFSINLSIFFYIYEYDFVVLFWLGEEASRIM